MRSLLTRGNVALASLLPAWVVYVIAWPHEIFHYGMARLLGVPAKIVPGKVVFDKTDSRRKALILLAPLVGGLLILPFSGLWALWWWSGCIGDVMDLWIIVRKA